MSRRQGQHHYWKPSPRVPLHDISGNIVGTCGISKDITSLKMTEEALHAANANLASQKMQLEKSLADLKSTNEELKAAQERLAQLEKAK